MGNSFSSTEKGASHRNWRLFGVEKRGLTFTFSLARSTLAEERLRRPVQDLRTGEPRMDIDELGRLHLKTQLSMLACEECGRPGPNKAWRLLGESGVLCPRSLPI